MTTKKSTRKHNFGPRGSARGLRDQIDRGCPRCGGMVDAVGDSVMMIVCRRCGDRFRAATGDHIDRLHKSARIESEDVW